MISTKLVRLPTRGALGNGLRVVAGAVLSSEGTLTVITGNQRIRLAPQFHDGTSKVLGVSAAKARPGTRIEIGLGPALPVDKDPLHWAEAAILMRGGKPYEGRSSPFWYDVPQFHELLSASGKRPVRDLVANLDGCTGTKAGEIVSAARLGRAECGDVTRGQAAKLLLAARESAKPVSADRLGGLGPDHAHFVNHAYAKAIGTNQFGAVKPLAEIPFVVETWVRPAKGGKSLLTVCINRTPVAGSIYASRDNREINFFGCGLAHTITTAPKEKDFTIWLNITTPFMPITSDGKAPDLKPFLTEIRGAVEKAVRKVQRLNTGTKGRTQKDIVLENLDAAIEQAGGGYRFGERQLLYVLRPIVMEEIRKELKIGNFKSIITKYENDHGEIEGMYREPSSRCTRHH